MNEYLLITLKTLLFLLIILIIIRFMGKRELGELNVFDIIISFMISEIFSNAIADPYSNVFLAILPIIIIFMVQIAISFLVLKSKKMRYLIESKPSLIIENGIVNYNEMKSQRYNISDLLQQVRQAGIDDLSLIKYAILESNGSLSVIKNEDSRLMSPFPLISEGIIDRALKHKLNISDDFILKELNRLNIENTLSIFIGFVTNDYHLLVFPKKIDNFYEHKNYK